jgi:WD40 repeat protein
MQQHTDEVWCCAWSSDGSILASASKDCSVVLWKCRSSLTIDVQDACY